MPTMQQPEELSDQAVRRKNGTDTWTLLEDDEVAPSAEEIALGELKKKEILRELPNDRERFIALALDHGYTKADIAYMLRIDPSRVTRKTETIRVRLVHYRVFRART